MVTGNLSCVIRRQVGSKTHLSAISPGLNQTTGVGMIKNMKNYPQTCNCGARNRPLIRSTRFSYNLFAKVLDHLVGIASAVRRHAPSTVPTKVVITL